MIDSLLDDFLNDMAPVGPMEPFIEAPMEPFEPMEPIIKAPMEPNVSLGKSYRIPSNPIKFNEILSSSMKSYKILTKIIPYHHAQATFALPNAIAFNGACHVTIKDAIAGYTQTFSSGYCPEIVFPKGMGKDADKEGAENMLFVRFVIWISAFLGSLDVARHASLLGDRQCLGAMKEAMEKGQPCVHKRCKIIKGDFCCNQHPMKDKSLEEKFYLFYSYPFVFRYQNLREA
jgi:hypothetical protein